MTVTSHQYQYFGGESERCPHHLPSSSPSHRRSCPHHRAACSAGELGAPQSRPARARVRALSEFPHELRRRRLSRQAGRQAAPPVSVAAVWSAPLDFHSQQYKRRPDSPPFEVISHAGDGRIAFPGWRLEYIDCKGESEPWRPVPPSAGRCSSSVSFKQVYICFPRPLSFRSTFLYRDRRWILPLSFIAYLCFRRKTALDSFLITWLVLQLAYNKVQSRQGNC